MGSAAIGCTSSRAFPRRYSWPARATCCRAPAVRSRSSGRSSKPRRRRCSRRESFELKPRRVLETAVYCDNLARTIAFYQDLLAVEPMLMVERVAAFDAGEGTVLLLFQRGASDQPFETPGGVVPGSHEHRTCAPRVCDRPRRRAGLARPSGGPARAVESRVDWPRGGHSIYFRDPDGRSVELATPGTWPSY